MSLLYFQKPQALWCHWWTGWFGTSFYGTLSAGVAGFRFHGHGHGHGSPAMGRQTELSVFR